ncbi:class I SAM-dependent methyltransferase [Amycolatopsis rifamycinica]|uniref:class I SAM-dependent methyltransferase n=1 Tax=Amycolatopsis rifamycinica TaxID=287986 RepID=UPI002286C20F|nr:class I SAM-dependent methyltransferase [Amycolatopsis rifamycinica]
MCSSTPSRSSSPALSPNASSATTPRNSWFTTNPTVPVGARAEAAYLSRFAGASLTHRNSGIDQYPILGAGLDSFAYRTPSR